LKFHVTAVVGALQFDHHKICLTIDCKQINPAATFVLITKLFSEHVEIVSQHFDLRAQQSLEIIALTHP